MARFRHRFLRLLRCLLVLTLAAGAAACGDRFATVTRAGFCSSNQDCNGDAGEICMLDSPRAERWRRCAVPDMAPSCAPGCPPGACQAGVCHACDNNAGCSDADRPACLDGLCVACEDIDRTRCPTTPSVCAALMACGRCDAHATCLARNPIKPICDPATHECIACSAITNNLCQAPTPACLPSGACVACSSHSHCTQTQAPICNFQTNECEPCTTDASCAAALPSSLGICLPHEEGRCATQSETLVVEAGQNVNEAIEALQVDQKTVIVINGGVNSFGFNRPALSATLVGRNGAVVSVGAAVGITVEAGELTIRDLTLQGGVIQAPALLVTNQDTVVRLVDTKISGNMGAGISATNGAFVSLERVEVEGNAGLGVTATEGAIAHILASVILNNERGGISIDGAGYVIENTVLAGNARLAGRAVALIEPLATPRIFRHNTVVSNFDGMRCSTALPITGSIVTENQKVQEQAPLPCMAEDTCLPLCISPNLDENYRLQADSPASCVDVLAEGPANDRDGAPRPAGSDQKFDCGADERQP